jgi:hypothetical protein
LGTPIYGSTHISVFCWLSPVNIHIYFDARVILDVIFRWCVK